MDEQEIKNLIKAEIQGNAQVAQYDVAAVPFHTHNNLDSPPISRFQANGNYLIVKAGGVTIAPTDEIDFIGSTAVKTNNLATIEANRFLLYRVLDSATTDAVATSVGGAVVMPFTGTVTGVGATVDTAGTTGTTQFDINKNTVTILSTKITIDSAETSSRTAATPPVISVSSFSTGDIYTFDIDTVQTTPALGLTFFMNLTQTA